MKKARLRKKIKRLKKKVAYLERLVETATNGKMVSIGPVSVPETSAIIGIAHGDVTEGQAVQVILDDNGARSNF